MAKESLSEQAYRLIRSMIVRLELTPGSVVREDDLQEQLEIGRTPIREALQRLARDQFLIVIPRELSTLYETRAILEPYVARLACERGTSDHWKQMRKVLDKAKKQATTAQDQIQFDAQCHEIVWEAAGNRFLTDTLDVLYAQSDRLWHMYLSDVADMGHALDEHDEILAALESGDSELVYKLSAAHVRSFDAQVRDAVRKRLELSVS
jgi:DNA-binding GntR family transcriptional regulator